MTSMVTIVPHDNLIITHSQFSEHEGLRHHSQNQHILLPGDPSLSLAVYPGVDIEIMVPKDDHPALVARLAHRRAGDKVLAEMNDQHRIPAKSQPSRQSERKTLAPEMATDDTMGDLKVDK